MRSLYSCLWPALRRCSSGGGRLNVSADMARDCGVLFEILSKNPQTNFVNYFSSPLEAQLVTCCDAAGEDGMGAWSFNNTTKQFSAFHSPWPKGWATKDSDPDVSSTIQELATILTVIHIHKSPTHLIFSDSSPAVYILAKGWSPHVAINSILHAFFISCASLKTKVSVVWHGRASSPGALAADALSHSNLQVASSLIQPLSNIILQHPPLSQIPISVGLKPSAADLLV